MSAKSWGAGVAPGVSAHKRGRSSGFGTIGERGGARRGSQPSFVPPQDLVLLVKPALDLWGGKMGASPIPLPCLVQFLQWKTVVCPLKRVPS